MNNYAVLIFFEYYRRENTKAILCVLERLNAGEILKSPF